MDGSLLLEERLRVEMDDADQILVQSVLGTASPQVIAQSVDEFCRSHLGQGISYCEFWEFSISTTFGLRLHNGERVVVKARHLSNISLEALQAACHVQQALAAQGFPCPKIILPPTPLVAGVASVEELVDLGERGNAHQPKIRQAMAQGLANLVQQALPFVNVAGLAQNQLRRHPLWGKPHNALFDFERTSEGAEWIDAIATQAREIILSARRPLVLGHMDWSVKNLRFVDDRISVVYDWDSLRVEDELVLVGTSARQFLVTWYLDASPLVPTPEEARQFVQGYEVARDKAFTPNELKVIYAAMIDGMAYTARCEHAIDPTGKKYSGSFREALHNHVAYAYQLTGNRFF